MKAILRLLCAYMVIPCIAAATPVLTTGSNSVMSGTGNVFFLEQGYSGNSIQFVTKSDYTEVYIANENGMTTTPSANIAAANINVIDFMNLDGDMSRTDFIIGAGNHFGFIYNTSTTFDTDIQLEQSSGNYDVLYGYDPSGSGASGGGPIQYLTTMETATANLIGVGLPTDNGNNKGSLIIVDPANLKSSTSTKIGGFYAGIGGINNYVGRYLAGGNASGVYEFFTMQNNYQVMYEPQDDPAVDVESYGNHSPNSTFFQKDGHNFVSVQVASIPSVGDDLDEVIFGFEQDAYIFQGDTGLATPGIKDLTSGHEYLKIQSQTDMYVYPRVLTLGSNTVLTLGYEQVTFDNTPYTDVIVVLDVSTGIASGTITDATLHTYNPVMLIQSSSDVQNFRAIGFDEDKEGSPKMIVQDASGFNRIELSGIAADVTLEDSSTSSSTIELYTGASVSLVAHSSAANVWIRQGAQIASSTNTLNKTFSSAGNYRYRGVSERYGVYGYSSKIAYQVTDNEAPTVVSVTGANVTVKDNFTTRFVFADVNGNDTFTSFVVTDGSNTYASTNTLSSSTMVEVDTVSTSIANAGIHLLIATATDDGSNSVSQSANVFVHPWIGNVSGNESREVGDTANISLGYDAGSTSVNVAVFDGSSSSTPTVTGNIISFDVSVADAVRTESRTVVVTASDGSVASSEEISVSFVEPVFAITSKPEDVYDIGVSDTVSFSWGTSGNNLTKSLTRDSVSLSVSSSANVDSYSVTGLGAGNYEFQYTVQSLTGSTTSDQVLVRVHQVPSVSIAWVSDTVEAGVDAVATVTVSDNISAATATFNGQSHSLSISDRTAQFTVNETDTGSFTLSVEVADQWGQSTVETSTLVVNYPDFGISQFPQNITVSQNDTVDLQWEYTGNNISESLVVNGVSETISSSLYSYVATNVGEDSFVYTVANATGNTVSATTLVTVQELPSVAPEQSSYSFEAGDSLTIDVPVSSLVSSTNATMNGNVYDAVMIGDNASFTVSGNTPGTYALNISGTDNLGKIAQASVEVEISAPNLSITTPEDQSVKATFSSVFEWEYVAKDAVISVYNQAGANLTYEDSGSKITVVMDTEAAGDFAATVQIADLTGATVTDTAGLTVVGLQETVEASYEFSVTPYDGTANSFQIISLPIYDTNANVITKVLEQLEVDRADYGIDGRMVLAWYDNQAGAPVVLEDNDQQADPARAYWFATYNVAPINISGTSPHTDTPMSVTLGNGWNMVANPYNQDLSLENILVAVDGEQIPLNGSQSAVRQEILFFEPKTAEYVTGSVIQNREGFWIKVLSDAAVITFNAQDGTLSKARQSTADRVAATGDIPPSPPTSSATSGSGGGSGGGCLLR